MFIEPVRKNHETFESFNKNNMTPTYSAWNLTILHNENHSCIQNYDFACLVKIQKFSGYCGSDLAGTVT